MKLVKRAMALLLLKSVSAGRVTWLKKIGECADVMFEWPGLDRDTGKLRHKEFKRQGPIPVEGVEDTRD